MPRQSLPRALAFKLATFLQANYTESALTDGKFAVLASEALGHSLSERNVAGVRADLEIPPNTLRASPTTSKRVIERIDALEARLAKLEVDLGVRS